MFFIKYSFIQKINFLNEKKNLKFFFYFFKKNIFINNNLILLKKNEEIVKINNFLKINKFYDDNIKKFSFYKNFWWFYYYWNSIIFKDHLIAVASNNFIYETKNYWHFFLIEDENVRFRLKIDDGIGIDWMYFSTYSEIEDYLNINSHTEENIKNNIKRYEYLIQSENIIRENNKLQEARTKLYNEKVEKSKINVKNRTVDVVELRKKVYSNFLNRSFSHELKKTILYKLNQKYKNMYQENIELDSEEEFLEEEFIKELQKKPFDELDLYESFKDNKWLISKKNKWKEDKKIINLDLVFKTELDIKIKEKQFQKINFDFLNYYSNLKKQSLNNQFFFLNNQIKPELNIEFLIYYTDFVWLYIYFFKNKKFNILRKIFKFNEEFDDLNFYLFWNDNLLNYFKLIDNENINNLNIIFKNILTDYNSLNLNNNQHFFLFFWKFFLNSISLNLSLISYLYLNNINDYDLNSIFDLNFKDKFFLNKNYEILNIEILNDLEGFFQKLILNLYFYENLLKIIINNNNILSILIWSVNENNKFFYRKDYFFFYIKNFKKSTKFNKNIITNNIRDYKLNLYSLLNEDNYKNLTEIKRENIEAGITIINFKKSAELRAHLVNLNYFGSFSALSNDKLFLFTSNEVIQDMLYFYQYQFEYFILKLMFLNCNDWKWIKLYLTYNISSKNNINLFFNIDRMYSSNFVQPINFDEKRYKILLLNSGKKKTHSIVKIISKLITAYISKLFIGNYYISLEKISGKTLNKNLALALNFISQSIVFELIRPNFIQEFIYICTATFSTGDPKFLLRWIIKVLHKISFKKHWRFLYQLKQNILRISRRFIELSKFKGLHIIIKGKIGALGCVRKKTVHIKMGSYGLSRYYLKGDMLYSSAVTQTGKIGVKIITSYK